MYINIHFNKRVTITHFLSKSNMQQPYRHTYIYTSRILNKHNIKQRKDNISSYSKLRFINKSKNIGWVDMANKLVPVGIARTRPCFDGKFPHWLGMGMVMGESLTFSIGYGDGYGDVHIPAIILVPAISPSSF